MPKAPNNSRSFDSLVQVVEALRGPDGCPWDKEQNHQTLTRYAIEETYELVEAMDKGDDREIREELGDVLLQVVLNAEIARQRGAFDINDVIESICTKMVSRHPHVFGDVEVSGSGEVLKNWQELKAQEKANKPVKKNFNLTRGLPALMASQKIGEKTSHMNFDWKNASEVVQKVREEMDEVLEEIDINSSAETKNCAICFFLSYSSVVTLKSTANKLYAKPMNALKKDFSWHVNFVSKVATIGKNSLLMNAKAFGAKPKP